MNNSSRLFIHKSKTFKNKKTSISKQKKKRWLIGAIFSILIIIIVIPTTLYYTVGFESSSLKQNAIINKTFSTRVDSYLNKYPSRFNIILLVNSKEYVVPIKIGYSIDTTSPTTKENLLNINNDSSKEKAKTIFKINLKSQEFKVIMNLKSTNWVNWEASFQIINLNITKPSIKIQDITNQEDWLPIESSLFSYSYLAKLETQSLSHLSEYPKEFNIPLIINSQNYLIPIKIGYLLDRREENDDLGVVISSDPTNHKQAQTHFKIIVNNRNIEGKISLFSNSSWNTWNVKVEFKNEFLEDPIINIKTKLEGNIVWSKIPNTIYDLTFDNSNFSTTLGEITSTTIKENLQQGPGIRVYVTINNIKYLYGILIGKFLVSGFNKPRIRKKTLENNFYENINISPESVETNGLIEFYKIYPWIQVIGSGDNAQVIVTKVQWVKTKWDAPDLTKENISFNVQKEILNSN